MKQLYTEEEFKACLSREKLPLECEKCGKVFHKTKHRIQQSIRDGGRGGCFCSHSCATSTFLTRVEVKCFHCNNPVMKLPSEISKGGRLYCSQRCAATVNGKRPSLLKGRKFGTPKYRQQTFSFYSDKTPKPKREIIQHICKHCGKPTPNDKFCNGSCRNAVINKTMTGQTSKAEKILSDAIIKEFPALIFKKNGRETLNGLELDFYFPDLSYAIEWNGIWHYKPIRGLEALNKIQTKDAKKIEMCQKLGIELDIIKDLKSHSVFITETINNVINKLKSKLAGAAKI